MQTNRDINEGMTPTERKSILRVERGISLKRKRYN